MDDDHEEGKAPRPYRTDGEILNDLMKSPEFQERFNATRQAELQTGHDMANRNYRAHTAPDACPELLDFLGDEPLYCRACSQVMPSDVTEAEYLNVATIAPQKTVDGVTYPAVMLRTGICRDIHRKRYYTDATMLYVQFGDLLTTQIIQSLLTNLTLFIFAPPSDTSFYLTSTAYCFKLAGNYDEFYEQTLTYNRETDIFAIEERCRTDRELKAELITRGAQSYSLHFKVVPKTDEHSPARLAVMQWSSYPFLPRSVLPYAASLDYTLLTSDKITLPIPPDFKRYEIALRELIVKDFLQGNYAISELDGKVPREVALDPRLLEGWLMANPKAVNLVELLTLTGLRAKYDERAAKAMAYLKEHALEVFEGDMSDDD